MFSLSKSSILGAAVLSSSILLAGPAAHATPITYAPYGSVGTIITADTLLFSTGSSVITFAGFSAADTDYVNVIDLTTDTQSGFVFDNQTAVIGSQVPIVASAGDQLLVELYNASTGSYLYSGTGAAPAGTLSCAGAAISPIPCTTLATASEDGNDHTYITSSSAGTIGAATLATGIFVGMEDLAANQESDFDYNDDQFILTGVSSAVAPEPASFLLFGTGLLGASALFFRKERC